MASLLVYGSYGFVGNLVAREATDRGLEPILAGRDPDALGEQVDDLDRPVQRFDLDDPGTVATAVSDVDCVLNCAGPFSNTPNRSSRGVFAAGPTTSTSPARSPSSSGSASAVRRTSEVRRARTASAASPASGRPIRTS